MNDNDGKLISNLRNIKYKQNTCDDDFREHNNNYHLIDIFSLMKRRTIKENRNRTDN